MLTGSQLSVLQKAGRTEVCVCGGRGGAPSKCLNIMQQQQTSLVHSIFFKIIYFYIKQMWMWFTLWGDSKGKWWPYRVPYFQIFLSFGLKAEWNVSLRSRSCQPPNQNQWIIEALTVDSQDICMIDTVQVCHIW